MTDLGGCVGQRPDPRVQSDWEELPYKDCVEVAIHFKCNHRCVHCMIEGTMDWLRPESDAGLYRILDHNRIKKRWRGITLTGAEVTLRPDLPVLARAAREAGFERVRIQTHGARLADEDFCRSLLDAGVNEYFVSVTASNASAHDAITGVPGSFERMMRGLEILDRVGDVAILTNTVITRLSYQDLPNVVQLFARFRRLKQMEFWAYWPMRETDDRNLLVSHLDTLEYLRDAVRAARRQGRSVVVKNFPSCLLASEFGVVNNDQPELIIDPEFWPQFTRNGFYQCVHRSACKSQRCLGLNIAYTTRFGWHSEELTPLR